MPEERPKIMKRDEIKVKYEVTEPEVAAYALPSGSDPGTVMVPAFNLAAGLLTLTPKPWDQLQGAVGKPAPSTSTPVPKMN